jgi:glycosyltransferase involved in cell wall biosynthesis
MARQKILQISRSDLNGGAAIAATRLHNVLRNGGVTSEMLVQEKLSKDINIHRPELNNTKSFKERHFQNLLQRQLITQSLTEEASSVFNLPYNGFSLDCIPIVKSADIINLHWINRLLPLETLVEIFNLNKPIVWTLHDQWTFTGGCHYTNGCEKYMNGCNNCPQLPKSFDDIAEITLSQKCTAFNAKNLTVVTPSKWLADCAKKSIVLSKAEIVHIPNGIDTQKFAPMSKTIARKKLSIPEKPITILFGANSFAEKRKGVDLLQQTINQFLQNSQIIELVRRKMVQVVTFGEYNEKLTFDSLPVHFLGYISNEQKIISAYNSANILVLPSREDNLPNIMLEAMACEIPVLGFSVGGLREVVEDGKNGFLAPPIDCKQLGDKLINFVLLNQNARNRISKAARETILKKYTNRHLFYNYKNLYDQLLNKEFEKYKKPQISKLTIDCLSFNSFFNKQIKTYKEESKKVLKPEYLLENLNIAHYIKRKIRSMPFIKNKETYALYGAGKHTTWLLQFLVEFHLPKYILDDNTEGDSSINEIPIVNSSFFNSPPPFKHIIPSSDVYEEKIIERCKSLFKDSIKIWRLYDETGPGPFTKRINL